MGLLEDKSKNFRKFPAKLLAMWAAEGKFDFSRLAAFLSNQAESVSRSVVEFLAKRVFEESIGLWEQLRVDQEQLESTPVIPSVDFLFMKKLLPKPVEEWSESEKASNPVLSLALNHQIVL